MKFPTMDEFAQSVAEKALDEIEYNGKTIRQWIEFILATDINVGELISRQQAIDALENDKAVLSQNIMGMSANDAQLDHYVAQRNQVVYDIDAIKQLPPIQPEPHWIPVTERLPESKEEDLEYPTVIIDLDGQVALGCYYESTREWGMGEYFNQKCFPIAWMPLPEPYKGGVTT